MAIKISKTRLFGIIKKFLPVIGIAIFFYLLLSIGISNIVNIFSKISPIYIILINLLSIPLIIVATYQYILILKKQKIKLGYTKALKINLVSGFYGFITPGKFGKYIRMFYVKKETKEPYGKLFVNNALHSTVSIISFSAFLIASALFFIKKIPLLLPVVFLFITVSALFLLYFYKKERGEKTFYKLINLLIPKKLRRPLKKLVSTFYKDFPKVKDLSIPILIDIPLTFLYYSQIFLIALALDIQIPFFEFILICPIVSLLTMFPISPGAIGIRELSVVAVFSIFGVDAATAMVLSLSTLIIIAIPIVFLGAFQAFIWAHKTKINQGFSSWTIIKKEMLVDIE